MAEEEKEEDLLQDAEAMAEAMGGEEETAEGEVDPLAEEMLKAMDSGEGEGGDDLGQMMEMEMLKAMESGEGMEGLEGLEAQAPGGGRAPAASASLPPNIARLMDVRLMVTIELGRTKKTVQEVLDLSEQSLIELDRTVAEPVEVRVNGRLFARGEVVTVAENFGVRITELVAPLSTAM